MSSAMPLTFPVLLCVASKDIIPTFDNHHSWSLAIAERVKVGGCPAITRGAIYQGVGVASTCQRCFNQLVKVWQCSVDKIMESSKGLALSSSMIPWTW